MPVYNGEAFVAQAVQSVLDQTHPSIELLVIDDGSPDHSVDVLRKFESIRIISQSNTGVAGARNRGIENATGEFVAFLDQDDWWLPDKLTLQLEQFAADQNIGLVHTSVLHIDSATGNQVAALDPTARPERMIGACFSELLLGNPIYNSSVMVRRSLLEKLGGCDLTIAGNTVADYDLWLRMAQNCHFGFVKSPVTCYRMHPDQGMHDRRAMLEAELKVLLKIREEKRGLRDRAGDLRFATLLDSLAVAYYDHGEIGKARQCFARALRYSRTGRGLVRWAVSMLPQPIVARLRSSSSTG